MQTLGRWFMAARWPRLALRPLTRWLQPLRWLLPAAFSAACGVALAVWQQGLPAAEPAADAAAEAAAEVVAGAAGTERTHRSAAPASTAHAAEPVLARSPTAPLADADELERLRRTLARRLDADVESALAGLLALNARQRAYLAEDLLRQAAERAPRVTLQWVESSFSDNGERESMLVAVYAGMAVHDPAFALNAVQNLADPEYRRLGSQQVLEAWAAVDVQAAYEWARARNGQDADELYVTVMDVYIAQRPHQAGELIARLQPGGTRSRLVDRYAFELAQHDAPAALAWLSQFEPDVSTQQALASVYDQWATRDPWAAIDHAVHHVDGELGAELIGQAATRLGSERPDLLAGSLHRIPDGYQTLAVERLAYGWAATDPERATRWVATLPHGELQAHARRGLRAARAGG